VLLPLDDGVCRLLVVGEIILDGEEFIRLVWSEVKEIRKSG
jgi:hypothetical protein